MGMSEGGSRPPDGRCEDEGSLGADRHPVRRSLGRGPAGQHRQAEPDRRRPRRDQEGKASLGSSKTKPSAAEAASPTGAGKPRHWDVPELIVESRGRAETKPPDRLLSTAQAWRDHEGTIAAYGYTEGSLHTMILPNLGPFRFTSNHEEPVRATVRSSADMDIVEDAFRRMVTPMVLQVRGLEILHASAALVDGRVAAFCGVSESGKSTVAYAFSRQGHGLWADDAVGFEAEGGGIAATPFPFRLRLRPASEGFFRGAGRDQYLDGALRVAKRSWEPAPLGALFALAGRERSEVLEVERMAPSRAFAVILEHAYCFSLADARRKRQMMRNYLLLVHRIPASAVRLPAGLGHIEESVRTLAALLAEGARGD